jgi:hypothetical protein
VARTFFAVACGICVAACAREDAAPVAASASVGDVDSETQQADLDVYAADAQTDAIAGDAPIEAWTGPCAYLNDVGFWGSHCPPQRPSVSETCCEEGLECQLDGCNYMGIKNTLECSSDGSGALRWRQIVYCDPGP